MNHVWLVALAAFWGLALFFIARDLYGSRKERVVRNLVHDALNNAVANGFADFVYSANVDHVACDLLDYDADIGRDDLAVRDLIPHIESWRDETLSCLREL